MQVYFPDSTNFGVTVARLAGVSQVVRTRFNLGYWMTSLDRCGNVPPAASGITASSAIALPFIDSSTTPVRRGG